MKVAIRKLYDNIFQRRINFFSTSFRISCILLLILNCTTTNYESPCNPASGFFQRILQVKAVLGDTSTFCGISSATLSRIFTNGNNSVDLSVTAFNFTDTVNGLSKTYTGTIAGSNITIDFPYGKITSAIPSITTNAISIQIGNTSFISGITALDFTNPVTFTFFGQAGDKLVYTVTAYAITPVADTNQQCYDNGVVQTCSSVSASHPNQDGHFVDSPNAKGILSSSTNTGYPNDPINIDTLKGIVWKTCQEGFSGVTCTGGSLAAITYAAATTACSNLNSINAGAGYAGLKKWRLPTLHELNQLMDHSNGSAFWNPTLFPNAPSTTGASKYRWTSSLILPSASSTMALNELQKTENLGNTNPVHCVNGDSPPAGDLVDNGDGTVLNKRTKLIWQKCAMGQSNLDCMGGALSTANWANTLLYCKNLNLAGKSWRLPSITELVSLLDMSKPAPFFDTSYFPNLTVADLHSSTTQAPAPTYDNILTIGTPIVGGISGKGNVYHGKCVSGP